MAIPITVHNYYVLFSPQRHNLVHFWQPLSRPIMSISAALKQCCINMPKIVNNNNNKKTLILSQDTLNKKHPFPWTWRPCFLIQTHMISTHAQHQPWATCFCQTQVGLRKLWGGLRGMGDRQTATADGFWASHQHNTKTAKPAASLHTCP